MKFALSLFILILFSFSANSQVAIGVFGGPQITSVNHSIQNVKQKSSSKTGFQLGMGCKVPIEEKLYFSPAVFYSMKGYKVTFASPALIPDPAATDNNTTVHTVETAAMLQYDFSNDPKHFFVKAGPSLDFQLFGHEKFNRNPPDGPVSRKMKFGYGDYGYFSANMLVQIGYEMGNGLMIFAQYTHGLANLSNVDGGPRIQHRVYGISIGKFLHKKKS